MPCVTDLGDLRVVMEEGDPCQMVEVGRIDEARPALLQDVADPAELVGGIPNADERWGADTKLEPDRAGPGSKIVARGEHRGSKERPHATGLSVALGKEALSLALQRWQPIHLEADLGP